MDRRDELGSTDCERIRPGFLSQPANALSSLAFLPAGAVMTRAGRGEVGLLTALIGIGSFAAHGPRWRRSGWLHDVTIAWALTGVAFRDRPRSHRLGPYLALGVSFALFPRANDAISACLATWSISREVLGRRTRRVSAAFSVLALAVTVGTASRTGWPLCRPDSLVQGHAAWHVLAAASLAVWGTDGEGRVGGPPSVGSGQAGRRRLRSRTRGTLSDL